jgi:hypothetical protein
MTRTLVFLILMAAPLLSQSQSLTEGAMLLFRNTKSNLTVAEKNKLFIDIGFRLSNDRKQFVIEGDDNKEFPFTATVMPVDLNKDGNEEVFVLFGNSFTSGQTGSSIIVFIKNADGKYTKHLNFPGTSPDVLSTVNKGYPDLLIGGPGFEYPVWKWNGSDFILARKVSDKEYEKLKKTSLEELSKAYVNRQ